jgi:hypothetical protein
MSPLLCTLNVALFNTFTTRHLDNLLNVSLYCIHLYVQQTFRTRLIFTTRSELNVWPGVPLTNIVFTIVCLSYSWSVNQPPLLTLSSSHTFWMPDGRSAWIGHWKWTHADVTWCGINQIQVQRICLSNSCTWLWSVTLYFHVTSCCISFTQKRKVERSRIQSKNAMHLTQWRIYGKRWKAAASGCQPGGEGRCLTTSFNFFSPENNIYFVDLRLVVLYLISFS